MSGARLDHMLANIQLMLYAAESGLSVTAFLKDQRTRVLRNGEKFLLPPTAESYFSVFAIGAPATGVTVTGAKYPLMDATLTPAVALGVSNEPISAPVSVSCRTGHLLVMWQEKSI